MMLQRTIRIAIAIAAALMAHCVSMPAQEGLNTIPHQIDTVRVEVARLRTGGIPLGRLPFSAQVISGPATMVPGASTLADLLDGVVGVSAASQFGSNVQPDLRFRGFQVGPVVGFPQSVSVFVDGVRVNEPDASQVNFDLIPMHAVERIEMIRTPGGPFGRNTLAGAINVVTRRGEADQRLSGSLEGGGGSFETASGQGWVGGTVGSGVDYFFSGRYRESGGWRDLSRTELHQFFGKVGYRDERTDGWLSYTLADNYVEGPGSLPSSWLQGNLPAELSGTADPRRLQFTGFEGDYFEPRLHFLSGDLGHTLGGSLELRLNVFLRSNRFTQFNDNITEANAQGETDILSRGGAIQLAGATGAGLRWTGGFEAIRNETDILIFEVANAAFPEAGGMTESVFSAEDNLGLFGSVWWPVHERVSLSTSLRYDFVSLPVTDRLDPENSGENEFNQLTGSLGFDLLFTDVLRGFLSYGRGFRAPVILEVSCADPEDPCPLPFELGADPPLDPVITDTWQAGLRWVGDDRALAELVGYWAEVHDDLFAVILPPSTRGYFTNLDRTRRQGIELSGSTTVLRDLELSASVALTRASFQTDALLASALADDDDEEGEAGAEEDEESEAVAVQPGDHFAMVPGLTAGWSLAYSPSDWRFELGGSWVGSQYFVGDESNEEEYGKLDGYFQLDGEIQRAFDRLLLFVRGKNLLDGECHSFGIIAPNVRGPDRGPQPFLSPGVPFHLFAGIRYQF
ncbi:MAG: TonB-dependent receptor [Gemmatimonas sp.]|nr:TonB-dependent receptor [Gemmatimonas sp.]